MEENNLTLKQYLVPNVVRAFVPFNKWVCNLSVSLVIICAELGTIKPRILNSYTPIKWFVV